MPLKTCSLCKKDKDLEGDFNKKSSSKDGRQNVCIICAAERSRKHYTNNTNKVKTKSKARKDKLQPLAREFIIKLLEAGCIDCPEKDFATLDFDHLSNKKYNIATMISGGYTVEQIAAEADKCVVRCSNCHRKKTAKDFNWWRVNL